MVIFRGLLLLCCVNVDIVSTSSHHEIDSFENINTRSNSNGANKTIQDDLDTKSELGKCTIPFRLGMNNSQSNWVLLFDQNLSNSTITIGLPSNCSKNDLMVLKPNEITTDQHFLLPTGQLTLPHRFWVLSSVGRCMKELIPTTNPTEENSTIVCTERGKELALDATDNTGRLQLVIINSDGGNFSRVVDKKGVYKCCDLHEVYLVNNLTCNSKESFSAQFVDQLQDDDFNDKLSDAITLVNYCPDGNQPLIFILASEEEDAESEGQREMEINVPKCCPEGQIVGEEGCQNFELVSQEVEMEAILLQAFLSYFSAHNETLNLVAYDLLQPYEKARTIELENSLASNASWTTPIFKTNADGNVSFLVHYYTENLWNHTITFSDFCLELKIFEQPHDYRPVVLYWTSLSADPSYMIYLHLFSFVALVATIWIYTFVPASSSAGLIISSSRRVQRPRVMACTLTGRNLLCYSISTAMSFILHILIKLDIFSPGEFICIALGYFLYWNIIASFAWSTVCCFDYVWIFRGSFQVSDTCKFIPYSIFGWGVPTVFVSIASVAQFQSSEAPVFPPSLNPNIGLTECWFYGTRMLLFGPVEFLLCLNVIFFIIMLLNPNLMNCRKKDTELQLRANHTKRKSLKADITVALKLFFISGMPWVLEFLHALYPISFLHYLSQSLNALRGVVIFIVFIPLQRNVRRHLRLRFRRYLFVVTKRQADPTNQSIGSSSQVNTESTFDIYSINIPSSSTNTSNI